jgi:S1-C subfamily serine protease
MRNVLLILAAAVTTAYAQDLRAVVRVVARDEATREAVELKRQGEVGALQRLRIHQPGPAVMSGVVISADGEILTPAVHPRAPLHIEVTFHDGTLRVAKLVGTDARSNLALLRVPGESLPHFDLNVAPVAAEQPVRLLGRNADTAVEGVGAVALPRISCVVMDRFGINGGQAMRMDSVCAVASPAQLPPGSACLDAEGRLCGLAVGGLPAPFGGGGGAVPVATTFVVPSARIASVVRQLREGGRVVRAYYGAVICPVPEVLRVHMDGLPASACAVTRVIPGGPADRSGLLPNDVVLDIDGQTWPDAGYVGEALIDKAPGAPVRLRILRVREELEVTVTPEELR